MYLSGKLDFENDLQSALKDFLVSNSVLIRDLPFRSSLCKEAAFTATGSAGPSEHPLPAVKELCVRVQGGRLDGGILLRERKERREEGKSTVLPLFVPDSVTLGRYPGRICRSVQRRVGGA